MSERPVECSQCKRPVKVAYKEILNRSVICTEMCADCPVLQEKLHGEPLKTDQKKSEICCGVCDTSLESVRMGQPVGCMECYTVFADFLVGELIATGAIPPSSSKNQPLHIGKSPDKPLDITLSSRLASLSEALNDALKRENYEQAAWLRDQIKSLTEKQK